MLDNDYNPPSPENKRWHPMAGFSMLELIAALSILAVLISIFSATLNGIMDYERALECETGALVILDNTLERLEAESAWNSTLADRIIQEEFIRSTLAGQPGFQAACTTTGSRIELAITKSDGRILAHIGLAVPE